MIAWFARNSVAANLLLAAMCDGRVRVGLQDSSRGLPGHRTRYDTVNVQHRGATPAEVEESVVVRIEEAIQDLEGIQGDYFDLLGGGLGGSVSEVDDGYEPR